jgi:galactose mutarotase-like enzyme
VLLYGDRAALAAGEAGARAAEPGGVTSGVDDVASGVRVTLETSLGFGSLALFCPPGRPFISLEPRSAVSDALTLMHAPGVPPTGVCALGPGETWRARVRLSAAPLIGAGR